MSERRVCRVLGQHRSTQRRTPSGRDDEERLTADIVELARQYGRYGYRKIVSVQREPSGAREVLRQERVDIFVGPAGGYSLECLRKPRVGIDVVEPCCGEQRCDSRPGCAACL